MYELYLDSASTCGCNNTGKTRNRKKQPNLIRHGHMIKRKWIRLDETKKRAEILSLPGLNRTWTGIGKKYIQASRCEKKIFMEILPLYY
jgi:hypothetical protein